MKILCISDRVEDKLYGPTLQQYAEGAEAVISCGDLPFEYLEYIVTFLSVPVYYVLGNHDPDEYGKEYPGGCTPLDGEVVEIEGVPVAGLSGSMLYSGGPNQYSEGHMRRKARALSAKIRWRKLWSKPTPRLFVAHSPPFEFGDRGDLAHIGFESFLPLIDRYEPDWWLHGHVHLYGPDQAAQRRQRRGGTKVFNVYGHQFLEI